MQDEVFSPSFQVSLTHDINGLSSPSSLSIALLKRKQQIVQMGDADIPLNSHS